MPSICPGLGFSYAKPDRKHISETLLSSPVLPFTLSLLIPHKMSLHPPSPLYLLLLHLTFHIYLLPLPIKFFCISKYRHPNPYHCPDTLSLLALPVVGNPNIPPYLFLPHPLLHLPHILPLRCLSPLLPL